MVDEVQLIERAIAGDRHCLNILFQMHYKTIYGYLIKLSGDVYLAEDLVQETLLRATLQIDKFRGDSRFLTYLIQIATNLYRNEVRKQNRITYDDELIESLFCDGEKDAIKQLQFKEAMMVLQQMSEEQRMSFILRHYYGYSIEEISQLLGVAKGTTKSRIHQAIQTIRKKLMG